MIPVGLVSNTAGGAGLVALFTLAVHRPFRYVAWVAGVQLVLLPAFFWLRPDPELPYLAALAVTALLTSAVVGWGMVVRSKRQLMLSLRDRARRAETEAALRAEQAQRLAREAIAREMHDVLAHRLTLLSVHAGALEFRPDAPREEVARAAGVIRESAHEALQDLREIIGVLRAGDSDEAGRPQPTLAALDALVAESRSMRREDRPRQPGRRPRRRARVRGPHRVPHRPGGTDERTQARAGCGGHGDGTGVRRCRADRDRRQPRAAGSGTEGPGVRAGADRADGAGDAGGRAA